MESLAGELSPRRDASAVDRQSSLYQRNPECWLESQARQSIQQVDAGLHPAPVYGQVPAFSGRDRGVIDLLAADWSGRLAVLGFEARQDIHRPLQGLRSWERG